MPVNAATIVFDGEAEDAVLEGMEITKTQSITHIIAEDKHQGSASFEVAIPQAGLYKLEAKTIAPDQGHDSFEVKVGEYDTEVWVVPQSKTWQWNDVATKASRSGEYELSAGTHTIVFYGRELTSLDRIKVSLVSELENTDEEEPVTEGEAPVIKEPVPDDPIGGIDVSTALYVNPDGSDSNLGTESSPFKTISRALDIAKAGNVILVAPGTYHETIVTVRSGTADKPIVLTALDVSRSPVIDLKWSKNGPIFRHDYITFSGFEVRNFDEGIRIEGATGVKILNNHIHHGENECVRVRYFSERNLIQNNRIHFCGATSPTTRMEGGNGEGIYIGTAPEQREKNGGKPDTSTHNEIIGNEIYDVTESVDLKEDSHYTLVKNNVVYGNSDTNSGAINVRGDHNTVAGNRSFDNDGSGYRFGGDEDVRDVLGNLYDYGRDNIIRDNSAEDNGVYGYKLIVDDQDFDCSNTSKNNVQGDSKPENAFGCF